MLGIKGLALAFLINQALVAGEVLEHLDAAFRLGHLFILRIGVHIVAVGIRCLPPLAEVDRAPGDRPLRVLHELAVVKFHDHPVIGSDRVLPGFVRLVDLADHGQRGAGVGVARETVDKGFQHVQCLDPAFLALQLGTDLEDRILQAGVVSTACEVELLIGLRRAQRALQFHMIHPCDFQRRLLGEVVHRVVNG